MQALTGRFSDDSLPFGKAQQDLGSTNCLSKAHSFSTPQSAHESLRTSSALKKSPKETN